MSKNFEEYILGLEEYEKHDPYMLFIKADGRYTNNRIQSLWELWRTAALGSIDRFCKAHNIKPMQLG